MRRSHVRQSLYIKSLFTRLQAAGYIDYMLGSGAVVWVWHSSAACSCHWRAQTDLVYVSMGSLGRDYARLLVQASCHPLPSSPSSQSASAMADSTMSASSRKPTGMKGKVHDLATTLQMQNEELSIEKGHVHSIKADNANTSTGMQGQLNDIKRYFAADVQRMMEEFEVQAQLQASENVRLQQQVTCLKGEKTSIHQQVIALQRRIEEIEEEIGHE
eukprot:s2271_g10.t1